MYYRSHCGCTTVTLSGSNVKINETVIKQLLNAIYSSKEPNKRKLFRETFKNLSAGVTKGFGKDFTNIAYNTPDFVVLNELQYNVGVFSIFKNHDQIKATVKLLKNDDGSLRSKNDFITEARKLNDTYNKRYLATEYDHAVSAARMSKKWQDIERTKDLYPNLQYVAVMDGRTRELHKKWHGIILPIDHKFWKTHYPPNGFGCRCTVRRTDKAVDDKGYDVDNMPKLPNQFNINVGVDGKVFDDSHPYFKIPEFKTVAKFAHQELIAWQVDSYKTKLTGLFKRAVKSEIGNVSISDAALITALQMAHKEAWLKNNLLLKLDAVLRDAFYIGSKTINGVEHHYLRLKDFETIIIEVSEDANKVLHFSSVKDTVKFS